MTWQTRGECVPGGKPVVLSALVHVCVGLGGTPAACLEPPQQSAFLRVQRKERTAARSEHQASRGRHQTGVRRPVQLILPTYLARRHFESAHRPVWILFLVIALAAAIEERSRLRLGLTLIINSALLLDVDIVQFALRIVSRAIPV